MNPTRTVEIENAANWLAKHGADIRLKATREDPLGVRENPDPEYLKAPWADPEFQCVIAEKLKWAYDSVGRMSSQLASHERDIEGFQNILGRVLKR